MKNTVNTNNNFMLIENDDNIFTLIEDNDCDGFQLQPIKLPSEHSPSNINMPVIKDVDTTSYPTNNTNKKKMSQIDTPSYMTELNDFFFSLY